MLEISFIPGKEVIFMKVSIYLDNKIAICVACFLVVILRPDLSYIAIGLLKLI